MSLIKPFKSALNLRSSLNLMSIPGVKTRYSDLDFVVIREQLEGEYSALEHESVPGVVECLKIITSKNSERIARLAFDYAVRHDRKKVTAVHKANIMKLGDGLFLNSCIEVSKLYPKIHFEHMIIDNTCMQLVSNPGQFDVMVMPNLYGNIIDNLGAGLVGGAGLVPGKSFSHNYAVFEPGARHAYSVAAGQNIANPSAILFACAHLLKHINLTSYAERLNNAIYRSLSDGNNLTRDVGGTATTSEFTNQIIHHMNAS
ncbi:Isocitrate dehydrogenase [NAD] subunit beta, mitochondrial [Cichlidogyrus casuarinus]|uniref:Isocitrate dehydrogenase [NAD] subunit beta, mitochondrial n=1 Tax=Cichlidogyrus casuarinus TaxID=1844966 RepID=A0ABD2QI31_9PLAT